MKLLNAEDLRKLQYGDVVYRFDKTDFKRLNFVGKMPRNDNYLIFCEGTYLTYLYISDKDNSYANKWYSGDYDSKFVGKLLIENLESQIEGINKIYLSDNLENQI